MKWCFIFFLFLGILLLSSSCSRRPLTINKLSIGEDYCQPSTYFPNKNIQHYSENKLQDIGKQLVNYPMHNLYTANAIGIIPLLVEMDSIQKNKEHN